MPHPSQVQRIASQHTAFQRAARRGPRPGVSRAIAVSAALVLSAGALSACSGGSGDSLPAPDQPSIRVGVVTSLGDVPFLIGVANGSAPGNGAFNKAGLTVNIQTFTSEALEYQALAAGSIDIAYGEYGQFFAADDPLAKNNQLKILSAGFDATSGSIVLLAPRNAPALDYKAIQNQQPGTAIAVPSATGPEYLALSDYMNTQHAPISSPIGMGGGSSLSTGNSDVPVVADPATMISDVLSGQVSAVVLQEPYATMAEEQDNLVPVVDLASGDSTNMPLDGYFASTTFVNKYPTTAADFSAVMSKLQAIGVSRTEVEAAVLGASANPTPVEKEYVATMQLGTYPTTTIPAKIDIVGTLMNDAGTISAPLDVASIVDSGS